jgi:hypothetical protein
VPSPSNSQAPARARIASVSSSCATSMFDFIPLQLRVEGGHHHTIKLCVCTVKHD